MKLLKDQIPEEQAANSAEADTQHARVEGRKGIPIYAPLNGFNVNETQARPKNLILMCTKVFLPLPETFRSVMRLYHGVKIDLVKPG